MHSCALLAGGAVKCWGNNYDGELGNGSNADSNVPVTVTGISTATALAVGDDHSCALLAGGAVQCWGAWRQARQWHHDQIPIRRSPSAGLATLRPLRPRGWFSCALLASGAVQCWGQNSLASWAMGLVRDSNIPVSVTGISTAVAIAAGWSHACAALRSGSVQCWGWNAIGQLGNGTTADSNTPVNVHNIYAPTKLAAGDGRTPVHCSPAA